MKVEELIIDGFKSYATRTVISGWDASFNCITGLNGSGKSNILDAICFVLGITTMSTVRAQNLQDLIYKRGQAGVTKASVSIVFDNSDTSKSPIGFEDQSKISVTRQIVLGGTSKFLINGHRAQQQTVQQLFQSVQLNINNPNFLIMQGRITKVLNMKHTELLALIEEAAGTRMFEERREKALKTMAKKDKKVEEILALLSEEIEPKLENLRNEKRTFLEYQETQSGLERMEKLVGSYDYVRYSEKVNEHDEVLQNKRAKLEESEQAVNKTKNEIETLQEEINSLRKKRENQIQKGGKVQGLERALKEVSQEVARINTTLELRQSNIAEEAEKKKELEQQVAEMEKKIAQGTEMFNAIQKEYEDAKQELTALNDELGKREELLQSLQTGVSSKSGSEGGYANQLEEARKKVNDAQTATKKAEVRVEHLETMIQQDSKKTEKAMKENQDTLNKLETMKAECAQFKSQLEQEGWTPGKMDELKATESSLVSEIKALTREIEELKRKVSNIDFQYTRPSPSFNPASVKGVVAQLFTLDKKNYKGATALEVCAGGRMYHVVVDTDATASQLLQKGQLRRRVTIIPLNKISAFKVSAEKLGAAQKIAPGKVDLALNLIGYDTSVLAAMEFVFGNTLVCEDAEAAKKVTFDPNVRVKTVTLDGDVYDPQGTLSGGSRNTGSGGFLVTMQKFNELNTQLKDKKADLEDTRKAIQEEEELMNRCKDIKKQMDLKEYEIKLAEREIESGPSSDALKKHQERQSEMEDLRKQIEEDKQIIQNGTQEVDRIERDMAEFKNNKGGKLEEIKQRVEQLQSEITEQNDVVRQKLERFQQVQVESGQLGDDLSSYQEQLKERTNSIEEMQASLRDLKKQHEKARIDEEHAQESLDAEKATLIGIDDELVETENILTAKTKFVTECGLEIQQLTHEIDKITKESESYRSALAKLEEEYDWIDQKQ
ncbi:hypothetical protein TRICI_004503 [Trichomonascus ciferrii]|uniref:SMC hinge domain-containing protein n=1 Tax=Trichomonascus ciferrii TaxID=44093 RepID=A0A642V733_9ASCO|nr:hypothetical protein TRICI_004503 [Trichomonascus ciferrii]